ncbi:MAG: DNA-3-methyladenine glycosylase 2 family protein [Chloroflexota bacterium]
MVLQPELFEEPPGWVLAEHFVAPCAPPYRLDLTVAVLRRTPLNPVDTLATDGRYLRAFADPAGAGPWVCVVRQPSDTNTLQIALYHPAVANGERQHPNKDLTERIPRRLGTGVDLSDFYGVASKVPEIASLVVQARGVKPPRYPSLWEALCNAVVFQQVSLEAAMATMRRVIAHCSASLTFADVQLYPFPSPTQLLETDPTVLRSLGLSAAKVQTLREVAGLLVDGHLMPEDLEEMPTADAMSRLILLRGIGPWTAAVVMLRGFGRLDVFPAGDSGALRNLRGLLGAGAGQDPDGAAILAALGPWRGMLYYHLLLWRLSRRGLVSLAANGL